MYSDYFNRKFIDLNTSKEISFMNNEISQTYDNLMFRIFLRHLHQLFADIQKCHIYFYILYFYNYLLYFIPIKIPHPISLKKNQFVFQLRLSLLLVAEISPSQIFVNAHHNPIPCALLTRYLSVS